MTTQTASATVTATPGTAQQSAPDSLPQATPAPGTEVIDAHAHVWNLARTPQPWIDPNTMSAIARDFSLEDLADIRAENHIAGTVLVQSAHSATETEELCAAVDHTRVLGAVGWVDLSGDVPAQLAELEIAHPGALVGIRHLAHQDPDSRVLLSQAMRPGIRHLGQAGLVLDLILRADQVPQALTVADTHPHVTFVLDHLGNPPVLDAEAMASWRATITELARRDNVVAKISGLTMAADHQRWQPADLQPVLETALAAFGPDRLLWGSDWPVVRVTGGAGRWLAATTALTSGLSETERAAIYAGTARRIYGLGAASGAAGA